MKADDQVRPEWDPNWEITEEQARFLAYHHVVRIEHGHTQIDVDRAIDWIDLYLNDYDEDTGAQMRFRKLPREASFRPYWAGLIHVDSHVRNRLHQIDEFEKKNKADRQEYERLKRKFEG